MIQLLITLLLTTCVARADLDTLAWWLLPNNSDVLPHEIEEDDNGVWKELWTRPYGPSASNSPTSIMEQTLGVRWMGMAPDDTGKPTRAILVLSDKSIIDFTGDQFKLGTIKDDKVAWSDGKIQNIIEFKKRGGKGRRKKGGTKINFGKISLPPLPGKNREISPWVVDQLSQFLEKIPGSTSEAMTVRDLSTIAQLTDPSESVLGFRYSNHCSLSEKRQIEDLLAQYVEPRLTCWMEQNPEEAYRFLSVLMQKPLIDCRLPVVGASKICGMATIPVAERFFVRPPEIMVATQRCQDELGDTLLHEVFHLAGLKENDAAFSKAFAQSETCTTFPGHLNFEDNSEAFLNDLQVETRMFLFRKVREDSVAKWKWSEAEKSFVLGSICAQMGDKFCARRYFQLASESNLPGFIDLPEGGEVSWHSLAAFALYDSVTEDVPRMHELVKYLHKDPNGTLLRRLETGVYRQHELYVARQALEVVKANRGICSGEYVEHIMCDDLAQLVKTPWFRNP